MGVNSTQMLESSSRIGKSIFQVVSILNGSSYSVFVGIDLETKQFGILGGFPFAVGVSDFLYKF